jgi:hypothetical protein
VFGYALGGGMAWPIVAVGMGMFSFAMPPMSSVALTYLTDAYTDVRVLPRHRENSLIKSTDHRRRCCRCDIHSQRHRHNLRVRTYSMGEKCWTPQCYVNVCYDICSCTWYYWTLYQVRKEVACSDCAKVSQLCRKTDGLQG